MLGMDSCHSDTCGMWLVLFLCRGDIVRLETYFAEDGRLTTRRDWRLTDATTGRYLGAATRLVYRLLQQTNSARERRHHQRS